MTTVLRPLTIPKSPPDTLLRRAHRIGHHNYGDGRQMDLTHVEGQPKVLLTLRQHSTEVFAGSFDTPIDAIAFVREFRWPQPVMPCRDNWRVVRDDLNGRRPAVMTWTLTARGEASLQAASLAKRARRDIHGQAVEESWAERTWTVLDADGSPVCIFRLEEVFGGVE